MINHIITVRDNAGNVISGASVYVYGAGTTVAALLYSDNGITSIANPITTNAKGQANFYVADGVYDLYVTGSNITAYTLEDVTIYEPVGLTAAQTLSNKTLTSPKINFAVSTSKTSAYTILTGDFTILCDDSGGSFTVSLPTAVDYKGRIFVIGKTNNSENTITIDPYGSETIDGVANAYLYLQNDYIVLQSDGANWLVLGKTWEEITYLWSVSGWMSVGINVASSIIFTYLLGRIISALGYIRTKPTGASLILDINKGGVLPTTIWTTQANRLTIPVTLNSQVQTTFNSPNLSRDDRLELDIDQVGSGNPGANLTVLLTVRVQGRYLS